MKPTSNHRERIRRAGLALDGLSVGDSLGETCFQPDSFDAFLEDRTTTPGPWPWTDDTAMAHAIYEVLDQHGTIEQDILARTFARIWVAEPWRGYGAGAHRLLALINAGADWRGGAESLFGGGSFGNGSAMRIAPLAAYFAEDGYEIVARQAALSAAVTHTHPEGIAGGIAAAVAGAYAWNHRDRRAEPAVKSGLFRTVLEHTPPGEVREKIEAASRLQFEIPEVPDVKLLDHGARTAPFDLSLKPIVRELGNGSRISCQDTVPFCLWVASRYLDNYREAIAATIRASGDIDTNCAIVGGIVALAVGAEGIPTEWRDQREVLRNG